MTDDEFIEAVFRSRMGSVAQAVLSRDSMIEKLWPGVNDDLTRLSPSAKDMMEYTVRISHDLDELFL